MPEKEATARIKINRLLEAAGWRFFGDGALPGNRGRKRRVSNRRRQSSPR